VPKQRWGHEEKSIRSKRFELFKITNIMMLNQVKKERKQREKEKKPKPDTRGHYRPFCKSVLRFRISMNKKKRSRNKH
jgi:hypothetical protein